MKKLLTLALAALMVLSLAACGGKTEAPAATTAAPAATTAATEAPATEAPAAEAPKELTKLNVAYMPNYASLWSVLTAMDKGYFADEGLEVTLWEFADGPSEIAAMEGGSIDISFIGPGAHKLCSTGNAQVLLLQHLGDGDCIIGLKGIKTIENEQKYREEQRKKAQEKNQ